MKPLVLRFVAYVVLLLVAFFAVVVAAAKGSWPGLSALPVVAFAYWQVGKYARLIDRARGVRNA